MRPRAAHQEIANESTTRPDGLACTLGLLLLSRPGLQAQGTVLGSFRWQLQPFCNVLTVNVVRVGGHYHLDGTDVGCGASRKGSVVGLGFPIPMGRSGSA